jgi:hypothetical protein
LILIALAAVVVPANGQTSWETVTSKEGQFTVEMPEKPSIDKTRTRKGLGGTTSKSTTIGCKTDSGLYLVYRIDLPTAIVKGTEDSELDTVREDIAEEWKRKVLTEKKVKVGAARRPRFHDPRQAVRGHRDVHDAGSHVPRREDGLRDDGHLDAEPRTPGRRRPVPRIAGDRQRRKRRRRVCPSQNRRGRISPIGAWPSTRTATAKFTPNAKQSLSIEIPGTWHDLNPHVNKHNAPRVVRTVDGDFSITVKVTGDFKPGGKPQNPMSVPSTGGGIVVWNNADNFIRLERFAVVRSGKVTPFIVFLERESGYQRVIPAATATCEWSAKGVASSVRSR